MDDQIKQGWGVTADETKVNQNGFYQLYMTDGSDYIYMVDGETMMVTDKVRVYDPETNAWMENLNELEFVDGYIYANVWYKDVLLKINP